MNESQRPETMAARRRTSWHFGRQLAVTAALTAAAFALGMHWTGNGNSDRAAGPLTASTDEHTHIVVQQVTPPAFAIDGQPLKNGLKNVAIVGGADGAYYIVQSDGLAVPIYHDRRNDLLWWSPRMMQQMTVP